MDTAQQLHVDCPACGGNGAPTGQRSLDAKTGRTRLEMLCDQCRLRFDVWRREWEEQGIIPRSRQQKAKGVHQ